MVSPVMPIRGAADKKRYHAADFGDIHQTLRTGVLLRRLNELVEVQVPARDPALAGQRPVLRVAAISSERM